MKTTLNWLKDYCACDLSAEDLQKTLRKPGVVYVREDVLEES